MGEKQKGPFYSASVILTHDENEREGRRSTFPFISDAEKLSKVLVLTEKSRAEIDAVSRVYPLRVPPFYADLIEKDNPLCPIRLQSIPTMEELAKFGVLDPLNEKSIEITPSFLKRYPKRGVFLVSAECAMYCRFCNRKRFVGKKFEPRLSRDETLAYLEGDTEIREVIMSGGDPFMLDPAEFDYVLSRLKRMEHVKVIRVSTRMPVVFPQRVELHRAAIRKHAPLWLVIHINHPREMTQACIDTIRILREAGSTVISQTVLLRRVNDCVHILASLFQKLVAVGVKPYYLFQLDEVAGARHFKVRIETGIELMRLLRGTVSGLCMPEYAVDLTGGLGKVPIDYTYVKKRKGRELHVENLYGQRGMYLNDGQKSRCYACGVCSTPNSSSQQ